MKKTVVVETQMLAHIAKKSPSLLRCPKAHRHVDSRVTLVPILIPINPFHTILGYKYILILSSRVLIGLPSYILSFLAKFHVHFS
jgi:hypothetical protein